MACLCIGMAVSGFQPLKSLAMVIIRAPGALAALNENSTLNGRVAGFGFGGAGGFGVAVSGVDGFSIGVIGAGDGEGFGADPVRGQKM